MKRTREGIEGKSVRKKREGMKKEEFVRLSIGLETNLLYSNLINWFPRLIAWLMIFYRLYAIYVISDLRGTSRQVFYRKMYQIYGSWEIAPIITFIYFEFEHLLQIFIVILLDHQSHRFSENMDFRSETYEFLTSWWKDTDLFYHFPEKYSLKLIFLPLEMRFLISIPTTTTKFPAFNHRIISYTLWLNFVLNLEETQIHFRIFYSYNK